MKKLFSLFFTAIILTISTSNTEAQISDPTHWTYEVKRIDATTYDLIFHCKLTDGWHIFSQKAGDEFLIPPSFVFAKNSSAKLSGVISEHGKLMTEKIEGIDNPINYYEHEVDFVQRVRAKSGGKITGEQEYQVCNASMCLPPKKKSFEFVLTGK